jgi:hypothetical protein
MSPRLSGLLVAVPVIALLVAGCASTDDDARPGVTPTSAASSSGSGDESDIQPPDDLSFASGADLDPRLRAQWGDPLMADAAFTLTTPDDGNGTWAYTQNSSQCEVRFWQGDISSITGADDDRTLSDAVLATWLQVGTDQVTASAQDDAVGYFTGEQSGGSWVAAARGLRAIDGGYVVHITCPAGQDAQAVYASVRTRGLTLVLAPGL